MAGMKPCTVTVCGLLSDITFHMAKCCAEDMYSKDASSFTPPDIKGMLEFEWDLYIDAKRKELRGETWVFEDKVITFVDGEFIGGTKEFLKWGQEEHNYENFRPVSLFNTLAEEAYKTHLNSTNHDFVFLDVTIGEEPAGRLVIELFKDVVPKTCQNFQTLCTGENGESEETEYKLHYEGSIFHRVVRNGWIQGGDIWMKKGDGGESVFGPVFEDENFAVPHDRRGVVGMANKGRHTNASQFYVTLQPTKWMDTKYVAFGQIIEGTETLKAMEAQETMNERPMRDIRISNCGVLTFEF